MSLSTQEPLIQELKTGLHLVIISEVSIVKGQDNLPIVTKEGENCLKFRFTSDKDGVIAHYEHKFWINGKSHSFFLKMCDAFKIDSTAPKFRQEVMGTSEKPNVRRGWIAIKEVHLIAGETELGEIEYHLFDFFKWSESRKKPKLLGDPEEGNVGGTFLGYKEVQQEYMAENAVQFPIIKDTGVTYIHDTINKKVFKAEGEIVIDITKKNNFSMEPLPNHHTETTPFPNVEEIQNKVHTVEENGKTMFWSVDKGMAEAYAKVLTEVRETETSKEQIIAEQKEMIAKVEGKDLLIASSPFFKEQLESLREVKVQVNERAEDTFISLSQRDNKPKAGPIDWSQF